MSSQKKITIAEFSKLSVGEMQKALDAGLVEDPSVSESGTVTKQNWRNGRPIPQDAQTRSVNGVVVENVGSKRGVVGTLDSYSKEELADPKAQEAYAKQLDADGKRFMFEFPQIQWQGEDGQENFAELNGWLKTNNVGGTYSNLVSAFNTVYRDLIFNPASIGLTKYGDRLTGEAAEQKMPAVDFNSLLKPARLVDNRPKTQTEMNSEEWKAAHANMDFETRFPGNRGVQSA